VAKKLLEIESQSAFQRAEFIFIEPDSPGRERELLIPFCEEHANCRCITLEERVGLYQAWNLGWDEALAPLICISNMDDAMHPQLLEHVLNGAATQDWDIASVLIAKQGIDADINRWHHQRLRKLELSTRPGPFFAWKRELKSSIGIFDVRFEIGGDKDFWARATHAKLQVHLIPKILYLYTKHPAQLSKRPEFKMKKKADYKLGTEKAYPYVWPANLHQKIRWIRWFRKVPIFGNRFLDV